MLESRGHLDNTALHSAAENAEVKTLLLFGSMCVTQSQVDVMRELIGNGLSLSSTNSKLIILCLKVSKNQCAFLFVEGRAQCT